MNVVLDCPAVQEQASGKEKIANTQEAEGDEGTEGWGKSTADEEANPADVTDIVCNASTIDSRNRCEDERTKCKLLVLT